MTTEMISNAMLKHDAVPRYLFTDFPNMEEQALARSRALDAIKRQIAAHTAIGEQIHQEIEELQNQLMSNFIRIQKSRCEMLCDTMTTDYMAEIGKEFWAPVHRLHILDQERYETIKREMTEIFEELKEMVGERIDMSDHKIECVRLHIKTIERDDAVQEKEEARLITLRDETAKNLAHLATLKGSLERYKKW